MPTGVWMTGARGCVATTAMLGLLGCPGRTGRTHRRRDRASPPPMPAFLAGPTGSWAASA